VATKREDASRQRRRPAELRELILAAAEDTFSRLGYADTSTVEVARAAGVTRSVLARHFPTKQDLFRAAMEQPLRSFVADWGPTWRAQLDAPWSDTDLMREFIADLYRNVQAHRGAVRLLLLHGDQLDADLAGDVWEALHLGVSTLCEVAEREFPRRGFPAVHIDLTVRAVLSTILGFVALESAFELMPGRETAGEDEVIAHLADLLLHGFDLGRPVES
jgi:AcrR family transcriptional regulator